MALMCAPATQLCCLLHPSCMLKKHEANMNRMPAPMHEVREVLAAAKYSLTQPHPCTCHRALVGAGVGTSFAAGNDPLTSAEAIFSFTSVFELVPSLNMSCTHAPRLGASATLECEPSALPTGVSCNAAQCGQSAGRPADDPFFLPVDLYNASVWEDIGIGPAQALAAAGAPPRALTSRQRTHLQVCNARPLLL